MKPDCRGFTLIELLIVVVILGLLGAMAVPLYEDTLAESHRTALVQDFHGIYNALIQYYTDNGKFPSEADFDLETLAPLSTEGYLPGARALMGKLEDQTLLIYLAPDVNGTDKQFILIGRADYDRDVVPVVIYTNIITSEGWLNGVYIISDGELEEASEVL